MLGSVNVKVRSTRLAYLVRPDNAQQIREVFLLRGIIEESRDARRIWGSI